MPWIDIVAALILVGIVGWFLNTHTQVTGPIRMALNVVLMLIVVGIGLWLIDTYIPMAGSIKAILNIVVVLATCVGVLKTFGLWSDVVRLWSHLTNNRSPR